MQQRHAIERDVEQVGGNLAQKGGEGDVVGRVVVGAAVGGDLEIGRQRRELAQFRRAR